MTEKRSAGEEAARYLAPRMRSVQELRRHHQEKEYETAEIREVIQEFTDLGYLDDSAYARSYCEYAYARNRGERRILLELAERGIGTETARNACEDVRFELGIEERNAALQVARKTADGSPVLPGSRLQAKIARKLDQLGYSQGTILSVLSEMRSEGEE